MSSAGRISARDIGSAPAQVLGAVGEGLAEISLNHNATQTSLGWGGDAANVCVMAARLGASVRFAGRVGRDAFGRGLTAFWTSNGIDVSWVSEDPDRPTGMYLNEPADDGGHRFIYHRQSSAGSRLAPDDLTASFSEGLGVLVVTGITLAVSRSSSAAAHAAVTAARAHGARIACVLNHRPALGGDTDELAEFASRSDVLIASREDLAHVFGNADPATVSAVADGVAEFLVTDGAKPVVVICGDRAFMQEVPATAARNAAGAGDALAGAYLACRLRGESSARSLAWSVAAATLSVGCDGCASTYPNAAETAALAEVMPKAESVPFV